MTLLRRKYRWCHRLRRAILGVMGDPVNQVRKAAGLAAVAAWEAEHGAFTAAEVAEADAVLDSIGVPNGEPG